jgi:hypothetical protein
MTRSPAAHLVQGVSREGAGQGNVSVYVEGGAVFCNFGGILLKLGPAQAKWLSSELLHKALMLDGRVA